MKKFIAPMAFAVTLFMQLNTAVAANPANSIDTLPLSDVDKTPLITTRIIGALEQLHYRKMDFDEKASKLAFKQYVERLDYGKQFFLQSDIKKLKKYENNIRNEMKSGRLDLLNDGATILKQRIKLVQGYQTEIFKAGFDFEADETLEGDVDKRDYAANEKELKELWRKLFKQSVLSKLSGLLSEQDAEVNPKLKKGEKPKKISKENSLKGLTTDQLLKRAIADVDKKYKKLLERMLEDEYSDYLEKYINAVTTVYDPHTNYFPPSRKEDFDIEMSGSLEGIGAVLQEDPPYIKVVEIVPGGAAWRQKELEVDDVILSAAQEDGEPVDLVDMRVSKAVTYIRGKKGTTVTLRVKKTDGSQKIIPIVREVVESGASFAKSSVLKSKALDLKVGYIYLPKFYRDFDKADGRNCTDDVRAELVNLKKKNVQAVILDLRNNGGGSLADANKISGLFVKSGPVVQVKDSQNAIEILGDDDGKIYYDGPLVVMVNRLSASASEILSGALQDYKRAVIVGSEFTHGKGTVQVVFDLNRGNIFPMMGPSIGALKLTLQKFYRITGASTQFKGVTPDVFLPDMFSFDKNREQDLDNALPWDEIKGVKYTKWHDFPYDLKALKTRSADRVENNPKFKKILKDIQVIKKKREDTVLTLNLKKFLQEEKDNKAFIESMKDTKPNTDLVVSDFETSLKLDNSKRKKGDEELWKKDFEKRKTDWVEGLQKDVDIEETLHIIDDMIKMKKGVALRG